MKKVTKRCDKNSEDEQGSRKKEKVDHTDILSDELLLNILMRLPVDVLIFRARIVCRRWFNLITNKLSVDDVGLIFEKVTGCDDARFVDLGECKEGLVMVEQSLKTTYNGCIKSWCNEYLLITDHYNEASLFFYSLITKEGSFLPKCSISCGGHYGIRCGVGLAYDSFKELYKVVHVFRVPPMRCELINFKSSYITTSKSSKWKQWNGPIYKGQRQYIWDDPVSVQGGRYFHWDVYSSKYLLSMDTARERFQETCLPYGIHVNNQYFLCEMSGFLALLHKVCSETMNIWVLKDFQRMEWEKLTSISMTSLSINDPDRDYPVPITIFKSKKYLIFRKPYGRDPALYVYNLKDNVMIDLEIDAESGERVIVQSITASSF